MQRLICEWIASSSLSRIIVHGYMQRDASDKEKKSSSGYRMAPYLHIKTCHTQQIGESSVYPKPKRRNFKRDEPQKRQLNKPNIMQPTRTCPLIPELFSGLHRLLTTCHPSLELFSRSIFITYICLRNAEPPDARESPRSDLYPFVPEASSMNRRRMKITDLVLTNEELSVDDDLLLPDADPP